MNSLKFLFLTFIVFFISSGVLAQTMTNAKIRILDSETQEGIEQANVLIQELMIVEKSFQFGISSFDNVPVRQITVEVKKEGYYPKKVELNLRENPFDNNFSIDLISQKDEFIAFFGTLKGKGNRIEGGEITLKIGSYKQSVKSDKQGDFSIEIPKNKISSDINLLIIHPKFKDKEMIINLKQGEKYKDLKIISLDYSGGNIREMKSIGSTSNYYWKIDVKNWIQDDNIVTVNLIVKNILENKPTQVFGLQPHSCLIFDENVSSHIGIKAILGNKEASGKGRTDTIVPFGAEPIVMLKFDVGNQKIQKISMVRIIYSLSNGGIYEDIPLN